MTTSTSKSAKIPRSITLTIGLGAWLIAVVGGVWSLSRYSNTPGPAIHAGQRWPIGDELKRFPGTATLVMVVHPQCPCSRASMNELEVLMTRCRGQLNACVLFVDLPGMDQDPVTTDLWRSAAAIKGVTCLRDPSGHLASRFHAETSGQVFVYDTHGVLRFSGGITASRGHAGDNDGTSAIEAIANDAAPALSHTPVFGCSLR